MNGTQSLLSPSEQLEQRLQLRPEVTCAKHAVGTQVYFQLTDPLTSRFYRVGEREWAVIRLMTGQESLSELLNGFANNVNLRGIDAFTPEDMVSLARWLLQSQLAVLVDRDAPATTKSASGKLPSWLNVAFLKIPLFNPDRLLDTLLPALRWTISPAAVLIWALFCAASFAQLFAHWEQFRQPIGAILAPDNWLYLLVSWVGLKIVHELYHGLVCKRYGGQVPACGLLFILFSPVAFVDVTSSWRFRSKWQRIFTAAAGMYAELFIAAVAVQYWLNAEHGIAKQMCHNLIATASLSTLLFNGNFLMRFDGYYMLSDLLEIQNLYSNGQQYIRYLFRRYLFGIIGSPLPTGAMKPRLTKLYGVASLGWRFSFYCGITFTAATMFHGAGIVIALLIGVGWFLVPALRFVQYLRFGQLGEQPDRRRFVLVVGGVTLGISLILSLPWPGGVVATGVVDYEPLTVVRASAGGFLRNLTCTPGESVAEGEGLAEIENRPVQQELADMNFQLEQSEIRCRSLQSEGDYDLYQIEKGRRDSLREQRDELAAKVAGLRVVAPVAGRVLGRDLESKTGEFMSGGEVILSLGREEHKAIRVAISQRDAEHYLRQRGTTPYVRIKGRGAVLRGAKLDRINPRATRRLPHPALAATNGGPLPVSMNEAETPTSGDHEPELIEPHFQAIITLPAVDAQSLRAGELARVRLGAAGHSIGSHLWTEAERWVSRKLGSG